MLFSLIMAWIAVVCAVLTAGKYFAKKNKAWNKLFHRIHIPLGIVLIAAGLIHGLFAGNLPGAPWKDVMIGSLLFTWNMGTVCFVLSVLLGVSYLLRKQWRKQWMPVHRLLTVLLAVALVIHVFQVGISLPGVLFPSGSKEPLVEETPPSGETAQPEETPHPGNAIFSGAFLQDGTYQGSAQGYAGTVTVEVLVENGEVKEINVLEQRDTPQFFQRAMEIIDTILDRQSLEVDGVSGATYSARGIQQAVYEALRGAVLSGELQVSEISIQGRHGHKKPR